MTNIRPHDPYSPAGAADPVSEAEVYLRMPANGIKLKVGSVTSIGVIAAMRDAEAAKSKPRVTVIEALDARYEELAAEEAAALEASVQEVIAGAVGKTADELQAMYEAEEAAEKPRTTLLEALDRMVEEAIEREEQARDAALAAAGEATEDDGSAATPDGPEASEGPEEPPQG